MAFRILMVEDDRLICEVVEDFFTEKSGGELELEFAVDGDKAMEMLYEELVKPYVKDDDSRENRTGSGVGLAIVENVARKLKYKIAYDITDEMFSVKIEL